MSKRSSRKKKQSAKDKSWLNRLVGVLLKLLLILILLSILPVILFRWVDPPGSMVIWTETVSDDGPEPFYVWADYDLISPHMALAVIAGEDQRFPEHGGFDGQAIRNAIEQKLQGKRLRGASTLSQQTAKNLFLWQGRSFFRKALEAWYTLWMEWLWPKQRILEIYLNIAETGPACYGVACAAERYFNVPVSELTAQQAALIAAVLPNPVRYRVSAPDDYVRKRQKWILKQMRNLGGIAYLKNL